VTITVLKTEEAIKTERTKSTKKTREINEISEIKRKRRRKRNENASMTMATAIERDSDATEASLDRPREVERDHRHVTVTNLLSDPRHDARHPPRHQETRLFPLLVDEPHLRLQEDGHLHQNERITTTDHRQERYRGHHQDGPLVHLHELRQERDHTRVLLLERIVHLLEEGLDRDLVHRDADNKFVNKINTVSTY
jgi:hypothetical protein